MPQLNGSGFPNARFAIEQAVGGFQARSNKASCGSSHCRISKLRARKGMPGCSGKNERLNMWRNNVVFVGIALAAASLAPSARASAAVAAATVGKVAPGFSVNDSNGAFIRLADYRGRVVLLNFWATWCHGCKLEIPWFMEFQTRYNKRGLEVIGVSMDEDGWKSVKPYLEKKPVNYPVVVGDQDVAKRYGLESMPMTVLIDRDGKIAASHTGVVDKAACENQIRTLLEDAASEPATK